MSDPVPLRPDLPAAPAAALAVAEVPAPGGRLARERQQRGWSVADAAEKLHLEVSVLEALEGNQFDKLGPAVFAKGHLKHYAALLNLPAAELVAAYEALVAAPAVASAPRAEGEPTRTSLPMSSHGPGSSAGDATHTPFPNVTGVSLWAARWARLPRWAVPAIAVTLVLIVFAGVMAWWRPWQRVGAPVAGNSQGAAIAPSLEQPPAPVTPINEVAPAGVPAPAGIPASPLPTTGAGSANQANGSASGAAAGAAAASLPPNAGRLRLRLSFSADSWVDVRDAGGAVVFKGKGRANSVKSLAGAAPLRVFLGSVSGVQLEINNQAVAIGPHLVRGDVARFEAGADGVLRRAPRP